jgi:hypothetical protein
MVKDEVPAWLLCYDLLTKTKDELILEAIDLLHEEIKAKRIDIQGYTSLLQDKPEELQRDMYIINNLILREAEIKKQYSDYLVDNKNTKNGETLMQVEALRKFLLSVDAISLLMGFSRELDQWAEDTGEFYETANPSEVIAKTMAMDEHRYPILEYVLSSKKFAKGEAISEEERKVYEEAIRSIPKPEAHSHSHSHHGS